MNEIVDPPSPVSEPGMVRLLHLAKQWTPRVDKVYLTFMFSTLSALPILLGTQPIVLNSIKNVGGASTEGDPNKQVLLLVLYAVGVTLILLRTKSSALLLLGTPVLLLMLWSALSVFWASDSELAIRRVVALFGTIVIGAFAGLRLELKEIIRLLLWVSVIVYSASLVVAVVWPGLGFDSEGRLRGVFAEKNALGHFSALVVLMLAAFIFQEGRGPLTEALGRLALGAAAMICLAFSQSASPIPSLAFGLLVLILAHASRARGKREGLIYVAVAAAAVLSAGVLFAFNADNPAVLLGRDSTLSGRTVAWSFGLQKFLERPILGFGYGTFWSASGPGALFWQLSHLDVSHAHNGYLQLLLDAGVVGLALMVCAILVLLERARRLLLFSREPYVPWIFAFIGFYLLLNMAEARLWAQNDLFTALFVAVIVRANSLSQRVWPQRPVGLRAFLPRNTSTTFAV